MNDLTKKFSKGTIAIHWLTALLILTLFPLGKYMEGLEPAEKMGLIKIHAILGIIVFVLTLIRSYLFFKSPRPEDLKTGSKFNDRLAIWIHNAFYFLLLGISISGLAVMILGGYGDALSSGNIEAIKSHDEIGPLKPHGLMAVIMMVLMVLHVVGVIKHYILTKENTLKRIF
ncbi:cytochrome b [Maribacter sp. HTCC2170]|uniref:cytochrome b n=1 Tax=Maribacter sp. (strain HTCC2170 / KCCM 42371) TaxID=313603 RepID=UPI00006B3B0C|nr:cytochrome b/b6 domain-containing protein [Maribacter sp. HTCC2170]EAQ99739.1 hypothetical protein FB2170_07284 [Maribacter sp. HTCC2170]